MFVFRLNPSITFTLVALSGSSPVAAQTGSVRGYPSGAALQQTPYYSAYYPAQYGYVYPPAPGNAAATYYAPKQPAAYAAARPAANYTLSPAGGVSAGSEAYAYYGQSAPLNYVPPTYYGYQTRMVQVPVTYYRPYTVYQPGVAAPVTCQRATYGTTCQPTRHRWFSCLDWLFHKHRCGPPAAAPVSGIPVAAVPAAVPRSACYANSCAPACGTPYYNTVPPAIGIPVVPGTTVIPSTVTPPGGIRGILPPTTVPPPGTRIIGPGAYPGTGGAGDGADVVPRIIPGTSVPPTTFPGTSGSGGFNPGGASYRSDTDSRSAIGSPSAAGSEGPTLNRPIISEPTLGPRRSVQPVPDPAATQRQERSTPGNRAPQLIDPNDRTAAASPSRLSNAAWDVVPAKWPEKTAPLPTAAERENIQPASRPVPAPVGAVWDDTLWKSAAR